MKKFEIYDNNGNQMSPVTKLSAVVDESKEKNLDEILDSKVSSKSIDDVTNLGECPQVSTTVRSMMEGLISNVKDYIITSDGWILNEETEIYEYSIEEESARDESIASLYLDEENSDIALAFDMLSYTETTKGIINLYSKSKPDVDIICDYCIITSLIDLVGSPSSSAITTELKSEIAQIKDTISITTNTATITADSWTVNEVNGYYETTITDESIREDSITSMKILLDYLSVANEASVCQYTYNYNGYFKLFSKSIPTSNIDIEYTIR